MLHITTSYGPIVAYDGLFLHSFLNGMAKDIKCYVKTPANLSEVNSF